MATLKERYNKAFLDDLCNRFTKIYPHFNKIRFRKLVLIKEWKDKELKERMKHIAFALKETLPSQYPKAVKIIVEVANTLPEDSLTWMILPTFVELYGIDYWEESLKALEIITPVASAEFAIRPFILKNPEKMIKILLKWAKSKNEHVRRLASEGSRPRLPWAMALPVFKKHPEKILPILEKLQSDTELYVRRSVANNLNDISKDHPEKVIKLLERWNQGACVQKKWLIKHALRTLEKKGHPKALALLGYQHNIKLKEAYFKIKPKKIRMGDKIEMKLKLSSKSQKEQNIVVDYIVYHMKANGKLLPKTFKWSKKNLLGNSSLTLEKSHKIQEISTRKYYSGRHEIHVQVNGQIVAKDVFRLIDYS